MISGGGGGSLCEIQMYNRTDTCHSDQISRSARRDGATKNPDIFILTQMSSLILWITQTIILGQNKTITVLLWHCQKLPRDIVPSLINAL